MSVCADSLPDMLLEFLWGGKKPDKQPMGTLLQDASIFGNRTRVKVLPEGTPVPSPPLAVGHEDKAPIPAYPEAAQQVSI